MVYLDVPCLTELLVKNGIRLGLRNVRREEHGFLDPLTRAIFGANKVPCLESMEDSDLEVGIFGGITGRVLFEFLSPLVFVDAFNGGQPLGIT